MTLSLLTATASIDGGETMPCSVECEVERIDVSTAFATKPDPNWELVDEAGHFHAYDHGGDLPTLKAVESAQPCTGVCDHDCEGWSITEYHCGLCDVVIEPRRIPDGMFRTIPGRSRWTVTVQGEAPRGQRVSIVVRVGETTYFGFGQVHSTSDWGLGDKAHATAVLDCGPFARKGKPPRPPQSVESVVAKVRAIALRFGEGLGVREALLAAIEPEDPPLASSPTSLAAGDGG